MWKRTGCLLFISLGFWGACSFPQKSIEAIPPDRVEKGKTITTPTKVYLKDGTVILFQSGFIADETLIKGQGLRFTPEGPPSQKLEEIRIPLDTVAAMTYYRAKYGAASIVGSVILDVSSIPLWALSLYCLFYPKECFGSCPTVYIKDNDRYQLTAELFSFSVGRLMESDDLDLLDHQAGASGGPFEIRVTNEALETHEINYLQPLAVTHPRGTSVYPDSNNELVFFRRFLPPVEAHDSQGEDVLDLIVSSDQRLYRSPMSLVERLKSGPFFDHLDLKIKVPASATTVNLLLDMRNTLLSTLLFYDLVLGSQGLEALTWTEKMNTDPDYAGRFWALYRMFSGIKVKVLTETGWKPVGTIHDSGPIAFKHIAARVPTGGREQLEVRLEFVPDNFMIDSISYDYDEGPVEPVVAVPLRFDHVLDDRGQRRPDVEAALAEKDDRYLTVESGESFRLFFDIPGRPGTGQDVSIFISSRGYYYEWLRGKWLSPRPNPDYHFDLNDVSGTLHQLAESWLSSKKAMEESFFKARIPTRRER